MPLKVVFWNINGRNEQFCTTRAPVAKNADILLLAESKIPDSYIKSDLGMERVPYKSDYDEIDLTPKLYSKIPLSKLEHYQTSPSKRLVFYTLKTIEHGEIILGCLHFPSKATYNGETQLSFANNYAEWVRSVEELKKHTRTILFESV